MEGKVAGRFSCFIYAAFSRRAHWNSLRTGQSANDRQYKWRDVRRKPSRVENHESHHTARGVLNHRRSAIQVLRVLRVLSAERALEMMGNSDGSCGVTQPSDDCLLKRPRPLAPHTSSGSAQTCCVKSEPACRRERGAGWEADVMSVFASSVTSSSPF